jgi:hypothetical protein
VKKILLYKDILKTIPKFYSYGGINSEEKASVNNRFRQQCDCKLPEGIVTCCDWGKY